jgi:hypothetical protein
MIKIYNLNVNDFGGPNNHLEEYKKDYSVRAYSEWDKIDKTEYFDGIFESICNCNPDIVIFQEYDLNSKEAHCFAEKMNSYGLRLEHEPTLLSRPSMTVFFIKEGIEYVNISIGHKRNARAYAVKVGDLIIYGTHVPPKYDEGFWKELNDYFSNTSDKYVLIGDFNTINRYNMNEYNNLLNDSIDVYREKYNDHISLMGDYVIASRDNCIERFDIERIEIDYTDHPGMMITIDE